MLTPETDRVVLLQIAGNRGACIACVKQSGRWANVTAWNCPEDGAPINDHATHGKCPLGKLPPAPPALRAARAGGSPGVSRWATEGPRMWGELHRAAAGGALDAAWLKAFSGRMGCSECKAHWTAWVRDNPLEAADPFAWTVEAHNAVNRRLGRPEMGLAEARAMWA